MILITGGAFQGKREFARSLKKDAREIAGTLLAQENLAEAELVVDFHLYIRKLLEEGKDVQKEVRQLLFRKPELILTVTELGCGIVPTDAFDRNYRETVGRICCDIAKEAEAVYRVTCGVGVRIK